MTQFFTVGMGGLLGAVLRYGFYKFLPQPSSGFPFVTLVVNVLGCLAIGALTEGFRDHKQYEFIQLFLMVGFLGAFTTFSAFSSETIDLMKNNFVGLAALNIFLNVALCLAGVVVGQRLVS